MQTGVDFSFAAISGAQVKAAGYSFVMRYLASNAGKRITAAQVADYRNNGLGIGLVFEDYANPAQNNPSQPAKVCGVIDAGIALSQANALGFPSDRPIYFAVDYDAPESAQPWIDDYLRGVASVIGANRVGVYGGFYIVKRCMENGTAKWGWQTVAWSGGQLYSGAHLYQNGNSALNGGADVNEAKKTDFGQWGQGGGDMSKSDLTIARILGWGVLGRNTAGQNALNGDTDADLQNHVGEETNGQVWGFFTSEEGINWRDKRLPELFSKAAQADTLTKQLTDANQTLITLQQQIKDLGDRPTQAQYAVLQKAAADANAQAVASQAALKKLQAENATADQQTTGFLRALWRKITGSN